MELLFRRYYSVGSHGGSLFGVEFGDDKDGVSLRTIHLTSQTFDCFIDGGDYVLSQIRDYPYMSHSNKYSYYYSLSEIHYNYFSGAGDGRVSVGTSTTHYPRYFIFQKQAMWGF